MKKVLLLVALGLFALSATAWGQEDTYDEAYLEMLRADMRTQKVAAITEVLDLTDAEGEVFWPIYREYELEISKLGDKRVALIKDFAMHYDTLSNEKAAEITFTCPAVHIGILPGVHDRFLCGTVEPAACAAVALRGLQNTAPSAAACL